MKFRPSTTVALLTCIALAGCSEPASTAAAPAQAAEADRGMVSNAINEAVTEARREIREGNISVSSNDKHGNTKAEISPQGDFLIDGRSIEITPEQRTLLLAHRANVAAVAEAGMEIGLQGADLATTAMKEAAMAAFSGDDKAVEARVNAEASKIKASALELCKALPAVLASQQKLAAALPEFRPYATMSRKEIDECARDVKSGDIKI